MKMERYRLGCSRKGFKEEAGFEGSQDGAGQNREKQNRCGTIVCGKDQEVGTNLVCLGSLK